MNWKYKILNIKVFALLICVYSCSDKQNYLLIEAESFEDKGGWVVDPQFVEQMGSPYLLAHGLGRKVDNAKTNINIPETGNYHIWGRTINWAPGNWQAPGRFRIIINGDEIKKDLAGNGNKNYYQVYNF